MIPCLTGGGKCSTLSTKAHLNEGKDDMYYVYKLSVIKDLYAKWKQLLPDVQPYYAVKCNPNMRVLQALAECGANFDCASPAEIDRVLSLGVQPGRILYANPCKRESDIAYMRSAGIRSTTADSICELDKLSKVYPGVAIIARIYANDPSAQCVLSNKFGAFREDWHPLIKHAARLGLNIHGVSFHIGSGACNPNAFKEAIHQAKEFADMAASHGHCIDTVDIGGGFTVANFESMARAIKDVRTACSFGGSVRFVAEPGRYFAETVATLYTKIIGVRERRGVTDYFIPDSIYGSFNCILYDHSSPTPQPVFVRDINNAVIEKSTIYGPTCDGFDVVAEGVMLPKMQYGAWLCWEDMGAYTVAGACDFNGIKMMDPKCFYIT